jgi:hypothetical protein
MEAFNFLVKACTEHTWISWSKHQYSGAFVQASTELIDNSISALRSILGKSRTIGQIRFNVNEEDRTASIEDNGPGFPSEPEELTRCWSFGHANPNGLNEHGCGAKTALSIFDRTGTGWKVYWKNEGSPTIYMIEGPLRDKMTVKQVDVWPGKLTDSSGTYMSFPCSEECFVSLYGKNTKKTPDYLQRYSREIAHIYLYEPNITSRKIQFHVNDELMEPYLYKDEIGSDSVASHKKDEFSLGENKVSYCTFELNTDIKNSWFKMSHSSLGIYIWKNGRFILQVKSGDLFERFTGRSAHPSMNGKIILVNLVGDQKTLPPTDPNKTRFNVNHVMFNEFVDKLYPITSQFFGGKNLEDHERDHMLKFVERRCAMDFPGYKFELNRKIEGKTPPLDLVEEYTKDDVRIYEGKRTNMASIQAIGQLHTNYILAKEALEPLGKKISKAILLLSCNEGDSPINELLQRQTRLLMQSTGCPFEIHSYEHGLVWPKPQASSQTIFKVKKVKPSKASNTT